MVVNVASFCTYTPQYAPLQQLYDSCKQYGFEIIGFPSDDFLNQGGTDSQIIHTCNSYGVTFLIMSSVHVSAANWGSSVTPPFQWLEKASLNGVSDATVGWNFNKFLIDEAGHWVRHYDSPVSPLDTSIINWIRSPSVVSSVPSINVTDMIELKSANPTNTSIDFVVKSPETQHYNIRIYSSQGQLINTIFDGPAVSSQNINYPVSSLSSGLYLITVQSKGSQKTFRYSVLK